MFRRPRERTRDHTDTGPARHHRPTPGREELLLNSDGDPASHIWLTLDTREQPSQYHELVGKNLPRYPTTDQTCITRIRVYTAEPPVDEFTNPDTQIRNVRSCRPKYTAFHFWTTTVLKEQQRALNGFAQNQRFVHEGGTARVDLVNNLTPQRYASLWRTEDGGEAHKVITIAAALGFTVIHRQLEGALYKTNDDKGFVTRIIFKARRGVTYEPAAECTPLKIADHNTHYDHIKIYLKGGHRRQNAQDDFEYTAAAVTELLEESTSVDLNVQLNFFLRNWGKKNNYKKAKARKKSQVQKVRASTTFNVYADEEIIDLTYEEVDEALKRAENAFTEHDKEENYRNLHSDTGAEVITALKAKIDLTEQHGHPQDPRTVTKKEDKAAASPEDDREQHHSAASFIPLDINHADQQIPGRGPIERPDAYENIQKAEFTKTQKNIFKNHHGKSPDPRDGASSEENIFKRKRAQRCAKHPKSAYYAHYKGFGGKTPGQLVPSKDGLQREQDRAAIKTELDYA